MLRETQANSFRRRRAAAGSSGRKKRSSMSRFTFHVSIGAVMIVAAGVGLAAAFPNDEAPSHGQAATRELAVSSALQRLAGAAADGGQAISWYRDARTVGDVKLANQNVR